MPTGSRQHGQQRPYILHRGTESIDLADSERKSSLFTRPWTCRAVRGMVLRLFRKHESETGNRFRFQV